VRKVIGMLALLGVWAAGCASAEQGSVLQVGSTNLRCPRSELESTLSRTTPRVREYLVGCDFMYSRVICAEKACHLAEVKPPCIGEGPCFEEDPVTLEWRLPKLASADVPHGR
jgi:hypothetical protein